MESSMREVTHLGFRCPCVELCVSPPQLSFNVPSHRHNFAVLSQTNGVVRRHSHINYPLSVCLLLINLQLITKHG